MKQYIYTFEPLLKIGLKKLGRVNQYKKPCDTFLFAFNYIYNAYIMVMLTLMLYNASYTSVSSHHLHITYIDVIQEILLVPKLLTREVFKYTCLYYRYQL